VSASLQELTVRFDPEVRRVARVEASSAVRVAEAATASIKAQLEERDGELRRALDMRNHYESRSKEFTEKIGELQLKLAPRQQRETELTAEVDQLKRALASLEATEATRARAHAKELADATAAVTKANSLAAWERGRAGAAGSKAREAKQAVTEARRESAEQLSAVRTEANEAQKELEDLRREMKNTKLALERAKARAELRYAAGQAAAPPTSGRSCLAQPSSGLRRVSGSGFERFL
jgi:chromosome segregation ATPase